MEVAKKECEKWDKCKYLQQTERDTPGKPGKPAWFARAEGQTGVDSEIVLWKRRGIFQTYYMHIAYSLHISGTNQAFLGLISGI